jgi:hypothetical protein
MTRTRLFLLFLMVTLSLPAVAAAEPCGGISYANGSIATGAPLPVTDTFDEETQACLAAIAEGLANRPGLRTVTVAARLPDADRLEGGGSRIASAYSTALVGGGLPASRVSAVAPAAGPTEAGSISIAFTEKRATQPVALAESVGGAVSAGGAPDNLEPITSGAMLPGLSWVVTGMDGSVALGLADGSRLRLGPNSMLLVGNLHLNEELRRVVELRLARGEIEARVAPGGPGSQFDVETRTGVAGVRGTSFRVLVDEDQSSADGQAPEQMRVETLEGSVEVVAQGSEAAGVVLEAGQALILDEGGEPGEPIQLLAAATVKAPLFGDVDASVELSWSKVSGAKSYRILVARDAEFTLQVQELETSKSKRRVGNDLEDGKWFWRVSAVDSAGYAGLPSKIYAFTLTK